MATTDEIVASFNLFAAAVAADQNTQDARITAASTTGENVLLYRTGGVVTPLSIGANLSVSGGALNATGGMGGGDVNGPATNNADYVPQWDGANSKILKNGRAIGAASAGDLIDRAAGDARYRLQSVALTKADVGLGDVDNTSDLAKPISTATQTALNGKQPLDGDLTALAALTGTNTIYYRSAADTWTAVTIGTNLTFTGGTLSASGGSGSGDVVGPASATNNGVALFDGTTGKLLKDGPLLSTYALLASPALTGTPTAPTATAGTNTTQLATTAFVTAAAALKANLASPTFTGTPAAPTATAGTSTTQLATTAFVTTADNLKANISDTLNTQTGTTYTLVAGDNGKVIELNNAAAITLTCPVLTAGFNVLIRQIGAGQVTVAASSTTARNRQSHTKLAGQWAEASIAYRTTSEFVFSGDTAA